MLTPMQIRAIPAFSDNYLWLLSDGQDAVVVDPGDAAPIRQILSREQLQLRAVLITHHHPDHIGGVAKLLQDWPQCPVYGPAGEAGTIRTLSDPLNDGDSLKVLGRRLTVLALPGHTLGHIGYYHENAPGWLFCGDTLFSAGCGRLFEGTPAQMHASLQRLAALPPDTRVYCTHEYTQANLAFALAVEPQNPALIEYASRVDNLRQQGLPSLPSSIGLERQINPFLRAAVPEVMAQARQHEPQASLLDPVSVFASLRRWKDGFRPPK